MLTVQLPNLNTANIPQIIECLHTLIVSINAELEKVASKSNVSDISSALIEQFNNTEKKLTAVRVASENGFRQYVQSEEMKSLIEQTAGSITITANQINLEGYTTINGNFIITEDGDMICEGGQIGNFFIGSTGSIFGQGILKVGGITLSGEKISGAVSMPSLLINRNNIQYAIYDPATHGATIHPLAMTTSGALVVTDITSAAYAAPVGLPSPAPSTNADAFQINRTVRKYESVGGTGSTYANPGEIYNVAESYVFYGVTWLRCTVRYVYNTTSGLYTTTPAYFWVPEHITYGDRPVWSLTTVNI